MTTRSKIKQSIYDHIPTSISIAFLIAIIALALHTHFDSQARDGDRIIELRRIADALERMEARP